MFPEYEGFERDHLSAIVEFADDAIISKDLNGIVLSWNRGAERMFGYSADEMVGTSITRLIPSDHAYEEDTILGRLRNGQRIDHYETRRVTKDGRILDVSLSVSPIRDSLGRIVGASKIVRDITERKQADLRLKEALDRATEAQHRAELANRSKDEFLATVSHELRTPMTAILGWTRMLASGELDPDRTRRAIETIDRNAKSQAQLIEDLLDVSRIISGKLRIKVTPVDLRSIITDALEAVRLAAVAREIQIHTIVNSEGGRVAGDSERLQQVVWNLLSNAIKFTPKGGRVHVELQTIESHIELSVKDTGFGISPEFLPYVFNRFSQADSSITRAHGGLGMGLAIVKSIVELHGGTVTAESAGVGSGSTFTVSLPLITKRDQGEEIHPRAADTASIDGLARQRKELVGLKVLVVDDEPDTCDMLKFMFNRCGAIVECANSALEGLDLVETWMPDILVSDIAMPEIDGYELIRRLRSDLHSRIPAVALSALARIDDRVKALSAGFQMHVAKPVEPVELISIVAGLAGLVNPDKS